MDRRRVLLIFGAAWLSAALLTWFLYSSARAPRVEKTVAIVAAARDLPAGTRLRKEDLKTVKVPERDLPKTALLDPKQALDRPLLFPVNANEPVTGTKIGSATGVEGLPAAIDIGKRAISVPITDSSGVSGLIQPRAHVDVLFTRPGSLAEAVTTTILEDVIVLAIGRTTEGTNSTTTPAANAQPRPPAQSATLLVTPEQSRKLELAKNEGKISLALRNPLDHTVASDSSATTSQSLYAGLPLPKKAGDERPKPPQIIVQKAPEPKEPPKPKRVVDVFRGDKHIQESF
ncbi:MAG: Flp pilus assembly protein CpaB [Terriglobia bacterium]|nr:MAG: Flp pilus assembly protein CpaB [Terriglobia bacterium]